MSTLECKHLIFQLANRASLLVAKAFCSLLKPANHGRGAAKKYLDVFGRPG